MNIPKINLNKRQKILISIIILLITSISVITLAFFTSTDEVTNRLSSESPEIVLLEPNWYETGETLAKQSVPGTMYPKDPYVTNLSNDDVYIRMKIKILDENGLDITTSDRGKAILQSIYFLNDSGNFKQLLGDDNSSNNPYFVYYNGYFYYGESTDDLIPLSPNEDTPKLFDAVITPDDDTYTEYFETSFSIRVSAEAIYVINNVSFDEIVNSFEGG